MKQKEQKEDTDTQRKMIMDDLDLANRMVIVGQLITDIFDENQAVNS